MRYLLIVSLFLICFTISGQKLVSFTIDDLPKTNSQLINKIDSLQIPVAIFINENKLFQKDSLIPENKSALLRWIENPLVIVGNHSYRHSSYSMSGFENFSKEITKGELITKEVASTVGKNVKYFRFPYNDLGKDSLQQDSMSTFLTKNEYVVAPFTIESSDWMFNALYENYLKIGNTLEANRIGDAYVDYTISLFHFFDSISIIQYGRSIKQIYLFHDNKINTDYIQKLTNKLKKQDYSFISLDEALTDEAYSQTNYYHKKYGITWIYRWMKDHKARVKLMNLEPPLSKDVLSEYEALETAD